VQEIYFQHWRYTRADRHLSALLERTPIYTIWDDHEVMNDFGARWDRPNSQYQPRAGYQNIVRAGRRALFAYGVLRRRKSDPTRLYRSYRWGRDLQLLILDTRSYRSRNELRDGSGKTMLGSAQLAWLKRTLSASKATWKVIATSSPVSVPTGSAEAGRDGWADGETGNGFERELLDLLRHLDGRNIANVVVVTGDLHFAQATRNSRDYDGDGDAFVFHEFVAGPLNARLEEPYWLDATTNPQSLYGEGDFFNFGSFRIVPQGKGKKAQFRAETYDSFGKSRPQSVVVLRAA
jgi:alkaline phosphatase D